MCRTLSGGGWLKDLSPAECTALLSCLAGESLQHAGAAIDFLGMWVHSGKPLEGNLADLAWRCLESMPTNVDVYDSDSLAAAFVTDNLDRAFRLLERLLTQPDRGPRWQPVDHLGTRRFWDTLRTRDKVRLLSLVFGIGLTNAISRMICRGTYPT
jgi:hypothetical protein